MIYTFLVIILLQNGNVINVKQICMIDYYHMIDSDDINESSSYCPPVWDDFLCWPRTRSGEDVSLNCPMNVKGLDPKRKFFYERCI